ncbi:MAG: hypothetical protein JWN61_1870 [Pseudonocardiales bacterium]|nr:hypothetical protein [Pseudonocardiales bacterium]
MSMTSVPSGAPVPASPAPNRFRAPSWLDLRLVLGIALVLGSVVLGARVVSSADERTAVWRTTHALAAGTVLTEEDLEVARVQLGDTGGYVSAAEPIAGQAMTRDVGPGELVAKSSVDETLPGTTVTIPVGSLNAPAIERGARVAIWVSTEVCTAVIVLREAAVQAVADDRGGFSAASQIGVVVRVDADLALRVVQALDLPDAVIRLGVLDGPAGANAAPLPDLAVCAGER